MVDWQGRPSGRHAWAIRRGPTKLQARRLRQLSKTDVCAPQLGGLDPFGWVSTRRARTRGAERGAEAAERGAEGAPGSPRHGQPAAQTCGWRGAGCSRCKPTCLSAPPPHRSPQDMLPPGQCAEMPLRLLKRPRCGQSLFCLETCEGLVLGTALAKSTLPLAKGGEVSPGTSRHLTSPNRTQGLPAVSATSRAVVKVQMARNLPLGGPQDEQRTMAHHHGGKAQRGMARRGTASARRASSAGSRGLRSRGLRSRRVMRRLRQGRQRAR